MLRGRVPPESNSKENIFFLPIWRKNKKNTTPITLFNATENITLENGWICNKCKKCARITKLRWKMKSHDGLHAPSSPSIPPGSGRPQFICSACIDYWSLYYSIYFLGNNPNQQAVPTPFVGAISVVSNKLLQEKKKRKEKGKSQEWFSSTWPENPENKALFSLLPAKTDV